MENTFAGLHHVMVAEAARRNTPLIGAFELTARCNLRCRMCYVCEDSARTKSRELTAAQWISLAQQAQQGETLYLLLTGGEPLIREDFWEIYEAIYRMGFLITLNTNATTITPGVMEKLQKRPPRKVTVSIYGSHADAYQRVCGNGAAFQMMQAGVSRLLKGSFAVRFRTVLTRQTAPDLPDIARMTAGWGQQLGLVNYLSPSRGEGGMAPEASRLNAAETILAEQSVHEVYRQCGSLLPQAAEHMEPDRFSVLPSGSSFPCAAGRYSYWVTWEGRMTPCALMEEPGIEIPVHGFQSAWNAVCAYCRDVPACQECVGCAFQNNCIACPARLKNETGCYHKKAAYLCERAERFARTAQKLQG